MPDNKISPEQLLKIEALKKAYVACFSGSSGKVVLDDLEKKCFYHGTTISKEPLVMAFREGMRANVLHIKTMMNFSLERVKQIAQEQQESEE